MVSPVTLPLDRVGAPADAGGSVPVSLLCLGLPAEDAVRVAEAGQDLASEASVCLTADEVEDRARVAAAAVLVVQDGVIPARREFQELRAHLGSHVRVLWVRGSDAAPPWDLIDEVVTGPVQVPELRLRLQALGNELRARHALGSQRARHASETRARTDELEALVTELQIAGAQSKSAYLDTIFRLALAAEYKDDDTAAHLHRISQYSVMVGREYGCDDDGCFILTYASMMHDVGKIAIPDSILMKPGRLTRAEWDIMRTHTTAGEKLLSGSDSALLDASVQIAGAHHEKWDGSGYPRGLKGEEIPLYARIVAVADVFDALTSERCYHTAVSVEEARERMCRDRGRHFDPNALDAFVARCDAIDEVQRQALATQDTVRRGRPSPYLQELGLDDSP